MRGTKREPTPKKQPSRRRDMGAGKNGQPATVRTPHFWQSKTIERLAVEQGIKPVESLECLRGTFWPEDQGIDEFMSWLRTLRAEGKEHS